MSKPHCSQSAHFRSYFCIWMLYIVTVGHLLILINYTTNWQKLVSTQALGVTAHPSWMSFKFMASLNLLAVMCYTNKPYLFSILINFTYLRVLLWLMTDFNIPSICTYFYNLDLKAWDFLYLLNHFLCEIVWSYSFSYPSSYLLLLISLASQFHILLLFPSKPHPAKQKKKIKMQK